MADSLLQRLRGGVSGWGERELHLHFGLHSINTAGISMTCCDYVGHGVLWAQVIFMSEEIPL